MDKENKRERLIELYVGVHSGDNCGEWYVEDVYVDINLPKEEAVTFAIELLEARIYSENVNEAVAFIGLYSFWDDEQMEELWEEEGDDDDWDLDYTYSEDYEYVDEEDPRDE